MSAGSLPSRRKSATVPHPTPDTTGNTTVIGFYISHYVLLLHYISVPVIYSKLH